MGGLLLHRQLAGRFCEPSKVAFDWSRGLAIVRSCSENFVIRKVLHRRHSKFEPSLALPEARPIDDFGGVQDRTAKGLEYLRC